MKYLRFICALTFSIGELKQSACGQIYTYDKLGRLTSSSSGDKQITFNYDSAGNMTTLQVSTVVGIRSSGQVHTEGGAGLLEQMIEVTLTSDTSFELVVDGLPDGVELHNASSAAADGSFRIAVTPDTGETSCCVTLQYRSNTTPPPVFIPQIALVSGGTKTDACTGLAIRELCRMSDGCTRLSFSCEKGRNYVVQYSDDCKNWLDGSQPISAQGTSLVWTDKGPPQTLIPPSATGRRFYRVVERP